MPHIEGNSRLAWGSRAIRREAALVVHDNTDRFDKAWEHRNAMRELVDQLNAVRTLTEIEEIKAKMLQLEANYEAALRAAGSCAPRDSNPEPMD